MVRCFMNMSGRTKLSDKLITQDLPTIPKVGRIDVTPVRAAGYVMDPAVSDPMANGTFPTKKNK